MLESTEMKIINSAEMYDMRKLTEKASAITTGSGWKWSNDIAMLMSKLRGKSGTEIR